MCNFLSAIVLKNGDVITDPENTDSHEDLVGAYNLRDTGGEGFVRVEFLPHATEYEALEKYALCLDEHEAPGWWTKDLEERITRTLRRRVEKMIVRDERELPLGGCWIIAGKAKVGTLKNGRVVAIIDDARIDRMYDSARIDGMYDSARIDRMWGSARIGGMYDSARIGGMYDSARIDKRSEVNKKKGFVGDERENKEAPRLK